MTVAPRNVLTNSQIDRLLAQQPITEAWPWVSADDALIEGHIKASVAALRRSTSWQDRTEYDHYGSGYASFVDGWLSPQAADDECRVSVCGIVILFSRLAPYYVVGEGEKSWHLGGSSSYLPAFDLVDQITHLESTVLDSQIDTQLQAYGWMRLAATDLQTLLPANTRIPTVLSDPPYRHFDALFYWEN